MGNVLNSSISPGLLLECREAAQAGQCLGVMMLLSPDLSPQFQPWGPPDCQRLCLSLLSHLTGMKTAPKRILSLSKGFCAVFSPSTASTALLHERLEQLCRWQTAAREMHHLPSSGTAPASPEPLLCHPTIPHQRGNPAEESQSHTKDAPLIPSGGFSGIDASLGPPHPP